MFDARFTTGGLADIASRNARNALMAETMAVRITDLAALTDEDLLAIKGIGPKSVAAIRAAIKKHSTSQPRARRRGGHRRELRLVSS